MKGMLSINFLPNAVYRPERCIRTTLQAAREHLFPIEQIMFRVHRGGTGAGQPPYSRHRGSLSGPGLQDGDRRLWRRLPGLSLLADFRPDIIKLDMHLAARHRPGPDPSGHRSPLSGAVYGVADHPLAEGVETRDEMACLREMGVSLMLGLSVCPPRLRNPARGGFRQPVSGAGHLPWLSFIRARRDGRRPGGISTGGRQKALDRATPGLG